MSLLGIGSNLPSSFGDRFKNIDLAVTFLESCKIKVIKKSSFYETLSYPDIKNLKFINIVVRISTHFTPEELVSVLIFVEEKLERRRKNKNEPRTCDIDIIDYNGKVIDFTYKNLIFNVPHEKLIYRNFVLFPLQEIEPKWKHPKSKDSVNDLINKLSNEDKKSILKIKKS